jgi:hypothetical protein
MTINNNISVLPFYTNINEQNHRKSYAYGEVYPLFCQAGLLLPFQIQRAHRDNTITQVSLYRKDGTYVSSLQFSMIEAGLTIVPFTALGYDIILFPAIFPISSIVMYDGQHYLTMTDGVETWYSEVFTIVQDMSPYLKIEWYNDENLVFDGGQFVFNNPRFHNFLYFATEVGKPEYTFEEEGESRDGFFFPEKQLSEKRYKCTILAPEYLCDVMRLIRMCDHVRVTDKYGRIYDCDTFLITPDWQEQGDLASVEIEFETDTVVKKIGRGYTVPSGMDFNNDYNNDYLITT